MVGILLIWISAILFVHLGLGKAICEIIGKNIEVFLCVKCLSFQSILLYSLLFTRIRWEMCVAIAFICAYLSLWIDLGLSYLATKYEKWYKIILDTKKSKHNTRKGNRNTESEYNDKDKEKEER